MKKITVLLLLSIMLTSCQQKVKIAIFNDTDLVRNNEMVEFCLCNIKDKLGLKEGDKVIILDANNKQVPYQLLANKLTVIFPVSLNAKDSAVYTFLIGQPDSIKPKTFARQVPERKDDFTWENDRIAFRMFGPALAAEKPSNGVDVWLKRTENLIINKFYKNDLEGIQSYHVDNGEGIDCYKVANTLGAGGIAPYVDTTLFVGGHYNNYSIIENGPLRSVFKLSYDTLKVGSDYIKQTLYITIDAGTQLNKAKVIYSGSIDINQLAAGIFIHDSQGTTFTDINKGIAAYAENAVSDAGVPAGRSYVGIIIPSKTDSIFSKTDHLLAVSPYQLHKPFVYYFGAGWSKWGFATDNDWFNYLQETSIKIKHPLKIKILTN
ncbi:MAG: DUF4861 family protein [Paludibacteraceae bacterium]|nr:DUF4861 family protein [Paludibacteraceae bacterium]MBN2787131.1 DUF4861 family protein [Paludibacteraceae bacterium]